MANDVAVKPTLSAQVAEEVRALLARRRVSGRKLAEALGVSPSWVSYRLTGTQPIDLNDLQLIAAALNVRPAELMPTSAAVNINSAAPEVTSAQVLARPEIKPWKSRPAERPGPNGHPNRTSPDHATRRPGRIRAAHAH